MTRSDAFIKLLEMYSEQDEVDSDKIELIRAITKDFKLGNSNLLIIINVLFRNDLDILSEMNMKVMQDQMHDNFSPAELNWQKLVFNTENESVN
jgi:hypothetical protein